MKTTVFNSKGGVGKSTFAANLAIISSGAILIDADTQASCSFWADRRNKKTPTLMEVLLNRVPSKLRTMDSAVIDLPGACVPGLQGVLKASDLVVLPITYDQSCFDALPATLELASGSRTPTVVVVNRLHPKSSYSAVQKEISDILETICTDLDVPIPDICPEPMRERAANKDWWTFGEAAADHRKSQSGQEIKKIYAWLKKHG